MLNSKEYFAKLEELGYEDVIEVVHFLRDIEVVKEMFIRDSSSLCYTDEVAQMIRDEENLSIKDKARLGLSFTVSE